MMSECKIKPGRMVQNAIEVAKFGGKEMATKEDTADLYVTCKLECYSNHF